MSRFGAIEEALFPKKAQPADDQIGRAGHKHSQPDCNKTSQELQMLSSVTINCQVTKIVMNSGSQLSE